MGDGDTDDGHVGSGADRSRSDAGGAEDGGVADSSGATSVAAAGSSGSAGGRPTPRSATRRPAPDWAPSTKIVVGVALGVAVVGAIYLARNALSLVALAGLIAFLVAPIIRVLQRRLRFPKGLALLTSYVLVLAGLVVLGGLVVDGVVGSVSEIDPPEAAEQLRTDAVGWLDNVRTINVGTYEVDLSQAVDPLLERLDSDGSSSGSNSSDASGGSGSTDDSGASDGSGSSGGSNGSGSGPDGSDSGSDGGDSSDDPALDAGTTGSRIVLGSDQVGNLAGGVVTSVRTVGGFILASIMSALVTFLVALYLNADSHKFHAALRRGVPDGYEDDADRLSDRFAQIWRGYLFGQLANSAVTGLLVWLVLWAVGLPGSFVFGLIMGVLNMIPTFGPIIAAVPGILGALALGSSRLDVSNLVFALIVAAIYLLVVQLQANLMAPLITGRAVQMSPAAILVGLLVGFQVGGLVGSLLVVPVLATLKEASRYVIAKLLDRDPFPDPDPTGPGTADDVGGGHKGSDDGSGDDVVAATG